MSKGAGAHGPHNEIQWNGFGRILLTHTAPYSAHAFPAPVAPPTKGIHAHRSTNLKTTQQNLQSRNPTQQNLRSRSSPADAMALGTPASRCAGCLHAALRKPVDVGRSGTKDRVLLLLAERESSRELLEHIPQRHVRHTPLIHREIALKHAPVRPE